MKSVTVSFKLAKSLKRRLVAHVKSRAGGSTPNLSGWIKDAIAEKLFREGGA